MSEMAIKQKQPELMALFSRSIRNKRLGHAYLFEGTRGTGKKELALWIAGCIFCEQPTNGEACLSCRNCQRLKEGNLPDLIELEPDGQSIKVDQIRHLKAEFSKSAVESNKKVYIIDDAEKMTVSAANSLLTFLEEPGKDTYLFLLTTVKENMLPTIRSRCQNIHFQPLKRQMMTALLLAEGLNQTDADVLAVITNDSEEAKSLAADEHFHLLRELSWQWFKLLATGDDMAFIYVQTHVMDALKEKSHSLFFLDLLLFHYRDLLYASFGNQADIVHANRLEDYQMVGRQLRGSQAIILAIESILEAKQAINANVQVQGLLESIVIQTSRR